VRNWRSGFSPETSPYKTERGFLPTASLSRAGVSPWQRGRLAPVFRRRDHFHRLALIASPTKHPAFKISWCPERPLGSGDADDIVETLFRFGDAEHGFDTGIAGTEETPITPLCPEDPPMISGISLYYVKATIIVSISLSFFVFYLFSYDGPGSQLQWPASGSGGIPTYWGRDYPRPRRRYRASTNE